MVVNESDVARRARRLRRLSQLIAFGARALAVLFAVTYLAAFIVPEWRPPSPTGAVLTPIEVFVAGLIGAVPLLAALAALWIVGALFAGFAAGAVFTPVAGRRLRAVGVLTLAGTGLSLLAAPAFAAFSAAMGSSGTLSITLSMPHLSDALLGLGLVALGHVMSEAADMRAELDGIV